MVKLEFVNEDLEVIRVEYWYNAAIPRVGDKVALLTPSKPKQISDGVLFDLTPYRPDGAVSGKVDWVLWEGDGAVKLCVV